MEMERFVCDLNAYREEFNAWLQDQLKDSVALDILSASIEEMTHAVTLHAVAEKWLELSDKHVGEWIQKYPLKNSKCENKNEAT